jgi:hypothetical protein
MDKPDENASPNMQKQLVLQKRHAERLERGGGGERMNKRDKPPPPGYERHPLDPNFIRKIVPPTTATTLWPNLPSEKRGVPVEQPKPNMSASATIWPNLKSGG